MTLKVVLLESSCSRCNRRGFWWFCRQCGAMYCDTCDCLCEADDDEDEESNRGCFGS